MKINIELDTSKGDTYESMQRLVNYEDYYKALHKIAAQIIICNDNTISAIKEILDEINML